MDKASILGDASDYVNDLRQKINDLQTELESISLGSSLTPTPSSPRHQSTKVFVCRTENFLFLVFSINKASL